MGIIPLIMTTFFEEFLFRGFFQNKFEKDFGVLPGNKKTEHYTIQNIIEEKVM